ncbi:MAG: ECF-type sigma factor [Gemmataceae bacterium]
MSSDNSVTQWIEKLKEGECHAAEKLWNAYFARMVLLAKSRLKVASAVADEEDVALSAFKSFCMGARDGRFPELTDRQSLWPLLVAITGHKSVDLIRQQNRQRRGGTGRPNTSEEIEATPDDTPQPEHTPEKASPVKPLITGVDFQNIISQEPTPDFIVQIREQLELLLTRLDDTGDPELRDVALSKMRGESTGEIAKRLGCVRKTIERKLSVIKRMWEREG